MTGTILDDSKVKISQNFVAFSEYELYIIKNENIHIYISFQHIVPLIVSQIEGDDEIVEFDEDLTHQLLVTLTNVAALTDWHHHYIASLPKWVII